MTIKEDTVIYAQHNQGRGHRDRGYGRSKIGVDKDMVIIEVIILIV